MPEEEVFRSGTVLYYWYCFALVPRLVCLRPRLGLDPGAGCRVLLFLLLRLSSSFPSLLTAGLGDFPPSSELQGHRHLAVASPVLPTNLRLDKFSVASFFCVFAGGVFFFSFCFNMSYLGRLASKLRAFSQCLRMSSWAGGCILYFQ